MRVFVDACTYGNACLRELIDYIAHAKFDSDKSYKVYDEEGRRNIPCTKP